MIPKPDQELKFYYLSISCNNKDACIIDNLGSVYLFQIDDDQGDIETGLDICTELAEENSSLNPSNLKSSSGVKLFFDKLIKRNKQDTVMFVDPCKYPL